MAASRAFAPPQAVSPEILRLPKCNLHSHLEGSLRPATVAALAREQGLALPAPEADVAQHMQVNGSEQSLADYLAKIMFAYPVLKNAAALQRASYEAAEAAAAVNVRYFELRAGPVTHATPDLPVRAVIAAILAGLRQAEAALGLTCRLIVAALRHHAPEANVRLAEAALDFRGAGVVGFDLAGDEARYPARLHQEAFAVARQGGLGITVHAGEAAGAGEVDYAVRALGATRIGHGVRSSEDEAVLRLLRERQVTLEVCPSSNVHTAAVPAIEAHPLPQFVERGLRVTIGDDDPITSVTNLARELALLQEAFGFTLEQLRAFQVNGMRASFLEDGERRAALLAEMRAA